MKRVTNFSNGQNILKSYDLDIDDVKGQRYNNAANIIRNVE